MPKVKDFMTKGVLTVDEEKTIFEAAELMSQKEVGDVVVLKGEIPRGIGLKGISSGEWWRKKRLWTLKSPT